MRYTSLFFVFLAALLIGCGGSTGILGGGTSPTTRTREAIKSGYLRALIGAGALGAGPSGGFVGGGGTTGGSSTGTTGGIPGFGFLVHAYSNPGSSPSGGTSGGGTGGRRTWHRGAVETTSGSTTGSATGGLPEPTFYYDDYLGLWLDSSWTDTSSTVLLYEDELKTKPAGSFVTTYPSGWDMFPYSYKSTFEVTAGTYSGAKGSYESVAESETAGHMTYSSTWPDYGNDSGESSYDADGGTWSYASTLIDGTWYHDTGTFTSTQTTFVSEDSFGYRRTYTYRANGSGHGRIEGPDPGLPATIVWDENGHTTITYADGTTEEWDAYGGTSTTGGIGSTTTTTTGTTGADTTGAPETSGSPTTTTGTSTTGGRMMGPRK